MHSEDQDKCRVISAILSIEILQALEQQLFSLDIVKQRKCSNMATDLLLDSKELYMLQYRYC